MIPRFSKEERDERAAGARHAAALTADWCHYQLWHPDFDTKDFAVAYRDYKAQVSLADVYFARGIPIPKHRDGIRAPEWIFR